VNPTGRGRMGWGGAGMDDVPGVVEWSALTRLMLPFAGPGGVVAAWSCAVGALEGEAREQAVAELVERLEGRWTRRAAAEALVEHWGLLSAGARAAARSVVRAASPERDVLGDAATRLMGSSMGRRRQAAAEFVGEAGLFGLAPELMAMLTGATGIEAEAASDALARLLGASLKRADARAHVPETLRAVVAGFGEHGRKGLLAAAVMAVGEAGPERSGVLVRAVRQGLEGEAGEPAALALRTLLRRGDLAVGPAVRAAWALMSEPGLRAACVDRLTAGAQGGGGGAVVAEAGHLMVNPARAGGVATVAGDRAGAERLAGVLAGCAEAVAGDERAALGLVRLVRLWPLDRRSADRTLAPLLAAEGPRVRLMAVAAAGSAAPACAVDGCFDSDERVALSAATALLCTDRSTRLSDADRRELTDRLARSPHESVRGLARDAEMAVAGGAAQRRLDAQELARVVREESLAEKPSDPRGLASLVRRAAELPARDGLAMLRDAVIAVDARVRANALETLVRVQARFVAKGRGGEAAEEIRTLLHAFVEDGHHRVRAAAVRGLLAAPGLGRMAQEVGMRSLAAMLDDPRPEHRLAALWAVSRTAERCTEASGGPEVVRRVMNMASEQGEVEALRPRAQQAAERLAAVVRLGWSERAASGAVATVSEVAA